jgi:hypothetical protein
LDPWRSIQRGEYPMALKSVGDRAGSEQALVGYMGSEAGRDLEE